MNMFKTGRLLVLLGIQGFASVSALWAQDKPVPPAPAPTNPATKPATDPAPEFYDGVHERPWFSHPDVRKQLQLSDDQFKQLHQGYTQSRSRYQQQLKQAENDLTPEQRMQRRQRLNSGFYDNVSQTTNNVFPDPAARRRFNQLQWQYRGYGALTDPEVQEELQLSETQRQSIIQANQNWSRRMAGLNRDYVADPDSVLKKFNESRTEIQEGLRTVLTPSQQRAYSDMAGKPYDFPAEIYFQTGTSTTTAKPVAGVVGE